MKALDILLAISVAIIWGMGVTFAKAALAEFPPILLMAFRFGLTAAVLVWFVRPPWRQMGRILVLTIIGSTIQYSLTFSGLKYLDASTAVLVIQLEVPFGALLATVFLRDRLGWRRAAGMALAFIGVGLIVGEPKLQENLTPLFLVVGGAFSWALAQILVKTLGRVGGFTLAAWVAVFATPQLFLASYLFEEGQSEAIANAGWLVWGVVVYLGLIMTALGYAIWYHLLGKYRVNQVMPFLLLLPVVTVIGGVAILGEELSPLIAAGGVIVITGVAMIILNKSPPDLSAPPARAAADHRAVQAE